jgi:hypothetical protein
MTGFASLVVIFIVVAEMLVWTYGWPWWAIAGLGLLVAVGFRSVGVLLLTPGAGGGHNLYARTHGSSGW